MEIKFEDEVQALLLLSSLPESWSGTVTAVSSSTRGTKLSFEGIRRKNAGESSNSILSTEGRGRRQQKGNNGGNGGGGGNGRGRSKLRNKEIGTVKVQWQHRKGSKWTWERMPANPPIVF